jgi:xanthine dehydrogenase accessory factor
MGIDILEEARALREEGKPFVVATVVRAERPTSAKAGAKAIITADGRLRGWVGGSCAQPTVIRQARLALADGEPRLVRLSPPERLGTAPPEGVVEVPLTCVSGGTLEIYLEPYQPKPHLLVIGHLPVAQALVSLGKGLGFRTTVISLEGSAEAFSEADLVLGELDLARVPLGSEAYIVIASHGNYDEEALAAALRTEAGYVALVASRKRAEAVLQEFKSEGLSEPQLARLKYPAGLDLGAVTPEEIALSILAEIVRLRRRPRPAVPLPLAATPEEALDPVCGMTVAKAGARYKTRHAGVDYYFCAARCQRSFEKEPETYLARK